jgi:glucosamine-phosphate N-acetyltransferase
MMSKYNYTINLLKEQDLKNGFIETLSFLRKINDSSQEKIMDTFHRMKKNADNYIYVALTDDDKVVGALTLLIEQKFIHGCGKVGHIEDVVVHGDFRGQGVARNLIKKAIEVAEKEKCYKVILNCREELVPFYEKLGFGKHEIEMRLDIVNQI